MRNFAPRSILQNEAVVQREQPKGAPFAAGVMNDLPASEVPNNGIAYSSGYIPRIFGLEAAGGVKKYSDAVLPGLSGRTGYSLQKSGSTVVKTVGVDFAVSDVGNFIVYDDGIQERITAFTSATTVTVENNDVHAASTAAWIHGPVNATYYHRSTGKVLLHIDTRLFYASAAITAYTEIYGISYKRLANAKSVILEERDHAVIISSTGIFKVDLSANLLLYYKVNSPNPHTLVTGNAQTAALQYCNKYLFSMARLTGDSDIRNRLSDDAVIEHETGTSQYDESGKDYAEVWHSRPVGDGSTTYCVLTGGDVLPPYDEIAAWNAITNGQFRISINGSSVNFAADFSDCKTLRDVAALIQDTLRAEHSTITCEFKVIWSTGSFVITNPEPGGTVSYVSAGAAGTDIGTAAMGCETGTAAITSPVYSQPVSVSQLHCPVDPTDTTIPQFHHTHYSVYRTADKGPNGIDPVSGLGNNEEQFVWVADVPIAKAFVAGRSGDTVTATAGSFQPMDAGAKLRFEDGTEVDILAYVSATQVTTTTSGTITSQSCAIGGDASLTKAIRVMTCRQSGTTVTRESGSVFSVNDMGKTIFFAGGLRAHITGFTSADVVTVAETQTILATGACMDPKVRAFTDTLGDDDLKARITNFSLRHRFWEPLPESSRGTLVPGFFFVWVNYDKTMFYGHLPNNKEHLLGSHNPDQYTTFKDKIMNASEHSDVLIVYCSNSTTSIPINTYMTFNVNDVLQYYKLSGQYVIDHERGLLNIAWLRKLPDGNDWLITNEPAVRICDGRSFSANLADNRYTKVIESLLADGSILYDRFHGITIFGED